MSHPTVSDDPAVQADYERMRAAGESHTLAEMFALQRGPFLMTDAVLLEGHANGNQFAGRPQLGDHYAAEAAKAGVNVKGKVYLSGLAAYPGDPRAWVSGRGDVQQVCAERGWACSGAVTAKMAGDVAPAAAVGLADDVAARLAAKAVAADPGLAELPAGELREKVVAKHAPAWAKKKAPRPKAAKE